MLSTNAIKVLEKRYLLKDDKGNLIETPEQMFRRVARTVAGVEERYGEDVKKIEQKFFEMMNNLEFLPNSPCLMNAGTDVAQLSACFVLPIEDSIPSIFDAVRDMALIQKSGGGVGFSFSKLRPKGDIVKSTHGLASGPVSYMKIFDVATDTIKQGGKRRGANMGILSVDHPDIEEFVTTKLNENNFRNFNLSVAVTDKLMEAVKSNSGHKLINPRNGEVIRKVKARKLFNLIAEMAWRTGDPGMIFIDRINKYNPTPDIGAIESTNPCGEQPLLPYESCNLGSINLAKMVGTNGIEWTKLREIIELTVRFLDDVINANRYPNEKIEKMTKGNRKIGLGVMGFADMLIKLGIPYDSDQALKTAEKIMMFISDIGHRVSVDLGDKRGSFPNFYSSVWRDKVKHMRNAAVTTIAPTGSISIIAACSSGIEPLFAVSFIRNVMDGSELLEVNPLFEEYAKKQKLYSKKLMMEIAKKGSIQNIRGIPKDAKKIFVTALDINPQWHVRIQAAFQKYTDNAVSKTVNLPKNSSVNDVKNIFMLAYELGCKGITVYRYGSKREQVLYLGTKKIVRAHSEYAGGCPTGYCPWS